MSLGAILDKKLHVLDQFLNPNHYSRKGSIQPWIHKLEDGGTLIEWVCRDCRFYISLETNPEESSWGWVSRCGHQLNECGDIPKELLQEKLVLSCCNKKWPVTYKFCPECGKVLNSTI